MTTTPKKKAAAIEGNRRPDIEKYLDSRGVQYEFISDLSPARFDRDRSLHNQARLGKPLDMEVVKRYAAAMEAGEQFPPVLANEERGKLVILDGNHRLNASIDVNVPLDAYICTAATKTLMLLTFEANTKHGLPSSEDDRLHHALFLMDNGLTLKEAATRLGISQSRLRKASTYQDADRRADDAGILRNHWDAIPGSSRIRLAMINTDEGFKAAVELVRDAGLGAEEISKVVTHLNENRSGDTQRQMIKALRDGMAERVADVALGGAARPGKRATGPQSRLAMIVGQIVGLPPASAFATQIPEQLREDTIKKLDEASERIAEIKAALS